MAMDDGEIKTRLQQTARESREMGIKFNQDMMVFCQQISHQLNDLIEAKLKELIEAIGIDISRIAIVTHTPHNSMKKSIKVDGETVFTSEVKLKTGIELI